MKSSQRTASPALAPGTRRLVIRLFGTLLFAFGQGCTSWRTNPVTPESFGPRASSSTVRVTVIDGTTFDLQSPHVAQDSLRGVDPQSGRPLTFALSDVQRLQARRFDTGRTVGLVLGIGTAALVALYIVAIATVRTT